MIEHYNDQVQIGNSVMDNNKRLMETECIVEPKI